MQKEFHRLWAALAEKGVAQIKNEDVAVRQSCQEALAYTDSRGRHGVIVPQRVGSTQKNVVLLEQSEGSDVLLCHYPEEMRHLFQDGVTAENLKLMSLLAMTVSW